MDSARNMFNGYISNHRIVVGTAVYTSSTFTPPTLPLTSIPNTRSLFSSPNSSQLVQDFSTVSNTTTNVGGVIGTGLNPFATVGSVQFNGSSQYLTAPSSSTLWTFGTGAFTIECWIYPTVLSLSSGAIVSNWVSPSGSYVTGQWVFNCDNTSSGQLAFIWAISSAAVSSINSGSSLPTLNAWNHVAVVRSGTTITIYLNGVSVGSGTMSTSLGATGTLVIGAKQVNSPEYYTGYISNVRIVNGVAVYSTNTNFTPPTSPLTVVGTQTSLLLNTPYGTQFIKDFSPNNLSVTSTNATTSTIINPFIGYLGNPASRTGTVQRVSGQGLQVSGSFDEFSMNRGSIQFNGSSQYLTAPANTALSMGTSDFTWELWVYPTTTPSGLSTLSNQFLFGYRSGNDTSPYLTLNSGSGGTNPIILFSGDTTNFLSTTFPALNTWHHIAITRSGTALRMFLNGALVSSTTNSTNFSDANTRYIGAINGTPYYFSGYISNLRIIKGVAVYNTNTNFTPPTQPFSSTDIYSTQTSILLNTVAYRPLNTVDSSLNNFTVTPTASPLPSELNPFQ